MTVSSILLRRSLSMLRWTSDGRSLNFSAISGADVARPGPRAAAERMEVRNVQFRLGEIEHLPVPDSSVDVILSNCVVNLVPDKAQVFREAHRVLRPGGVCFVHSHQALGVHDPPWDFWRFTRRASAGPMPSG